MRSTAIRDYFFKTVVALIVALAPVAIQIWSIYDLHSMGDISEKKLELEFEGAFDAMEAIQRLDTKISLSIDNKPLKNLFIGNASLKNTGNAPILPSDFFEPLTIQTEEQWKILAVKNDQWNFHIPVQWQKISANKFEAKPALLNPGDSVGVQIYITNDHLETNFPFNAMNKKFVKWQTRIVGLKQLEQKSRGEEQLKNVSARRGIFYVELTGWSLIFTVVVAMLLQLTYLYLLHKAQLIGNWNLRSFTFVVASSALGFTVAEVMATYIFGNTFTDLSGIPHLLNVPWLVLNIIVVGVLWWIAKNRQNQIHT